jgi:iron complex transport system ATP-binding protein
MAQQIIMTCENLGYGYRKDEWIFRGLNETIRSGEIFAILGPNGCGKSTLLRILLGLLPPHEGQVYCIERMGYVPQHLQLEFEYSTLDMVLMGCARQIGLFELPSKANRNNALDVLASLGMEQMAHRPFSSLSGGERQLAVIARALLSQSALLVLDEPVSALDVGNQQSVLKQLQRLAREKGLTILFTTHQPQHALCFADHSLIMLAGDAQCGATAEILTEDNLKKLYHVEIGYFERELHGVCATTLAPLFSAKQKFN